METRTTLKNRTITSLNVLSGLKSLRLLRIVFAKLGALEIILKLFWLNTSSILDFLSIYCSIFLNLAHAEMNIIDLNTLVFSWLIVIITPWLLLRAHFIIILMIHF